MSGRTEDRMRGLLAGLERGPDGIWSGAMPAGNQEAERKLREQVAAEHQGDYLTNIARHHSIPVMDHEVGRFLDSLPPDAAILDVGGCWGWHWRNLPEQRPEACVVIVDFVRANLRHARNMLGSLVDSRVALVHADATALPFTDAVFDGFWTVQTFQHIPDFRQACCEAHRVLKGGGRLANYSLHITPAVQLVYRLFGKTYHREGMVRDLFHLTRANDAQREILAEVFGAPVVDRYTECLFHPDLKATFSGRAGSLAGRLDARLGDVPTVGRWLARQRSFETVKTVAGER